ncbi:MAG: hypothetical protein MJZ34_05355 [Paludibacteraceae bacterium]|nr:hypothetical protein [Paludibacteraceae bacterium]
MKNKLQDAVNNLKKLEKTCDKSVGYYNYMTETFRILLPKHSKPGIKACDYLDYSHFIVISCCLYGDKDNKVVYYVSWNLPKYCRIKFKSCPSVEEVLSFYSRFELNLEREQKMKLMNKNSFTTMFTNKVGLKLDDTVVDEDQEADDDTRRYVFKNGNESIDVRLEIKLVKNEFFRISVKTDKFNGYFLNVSYDNYHKYVDIVKDIINL